jgi:asparagine synthetase B (glutamine-hydrolysing)
MIGYGWIDALKDQAEAHISDEQFKVHKPEWGKDHPDTKEAYWYRLMFDNVFKPHCAETVKRWVPSWGAPSDPYEPLHPISPLDLDEHKATMQLTKIEGPHLERTERQK